jgi:hypothetical protein
MDARSGCVQMVHVRGMVLVHEGASSAPPALRAATDDVPIAVLPQLPHGQPVARAERAQALAIEQTAIDHRLLARGAHPTEPREGGHADAVSFHASGRRCRLVGPVTSCYIVPCRPAFAVAVVRRGCRHVICSPRSAATEFIRAVPGSFTLTPFRKIRTFTVISVPPVHRGRMLRMD